MLEATVKLFNGKTEVNIQAEDSKSLIQQLAFFTAIPQQCDICGGELHFSFRNPDPKVKYWGVECEGTIKHTLNFGVHSEEEKGLFIKDEWEYYDREAQEYRKVRARDVREALGPPLSTVSQKQTPEPPPSRTSGTTDDSSTAKMPGQKAPDPQTRTSAPSTSSVNSGQVLSKERAEAMQAELEKLGHPKRDQLRLASSVLKKQVKDFTMLSEAEALEVWNYAKRGAR
jgi:hypothetical protein